MSFNENWRCLYADLFIIVLPFFPSYVFKLLLVFLCDTHFADVLVHKFLY